MTSDLNNGGNVIAIPLVSGDVYTVGIINRADVGLSEDAERFVKILYETIEER